MAKGSIIRALLKMKHSPAGKRYLAKEKKRTQYTYYKLKGLKRPTTETRLRNSGMNEETIKKMVGAKSYVGP
jgi:hypothetical protein